MSTPRVVPVPCLTDNYAYLVHDPASRDALVVDPSEAGPVLGALDREGLRLAGILATHHHFDHVGGIEDLLRSAPSTPVVASRYDLERGRVPGATRAVSHEERFELAGLDILALEVPGHTLGAVAFVIGDTVFTGDTLFVAGCGRLFEGTPADMYSSLRERLGSLPRATRVYCGHEYTRSNARFAAHVEPDNLAVQRLAASAADAASRGEPTVPSTIGSELEHNPFMRTGEPALRARFGGGDPVAVLGAVRAAKDTFR
ncbi:MAG: hydroxyacylglutathione hydrolase [Polyangiaceae bacterium]